jgi:hypothetical protein
MLPQSFGGKMHYHVQDGEPFMTSLFDEPFHGIPQGEVVGLSPEFREAKWREQALALRQRVSILAKEGRNLESQLAEVSTWTQITEDKETWPPPLNSLMAKHCGGECWVYWIVLNPSQIDRTPDAEYWRVVPAPKAS